MKKILILCTGNSCRSQMAAGYLRAFDASLEVHSAGTEPVRRVHPKAVAVMREDGVDISDQTPGKVADFLDKDFDFVITVCGGADESCPAFIGKVQTRLHMPFIDPAKATGTDHEIKTIFQSVRDEIKQQFYQFYKTRMLSANE